MRLILGLGHKRRRGKDTAAHMLKEIMLADGGFAVPQIDAFARSLKLGIGKGVFSLTDEQLYGDVKKKEVDQFWGLTPRDILQRAGTEAMRNEFGEDIWLRTILRRIQDTHDSIIITDVRFPNEAEALKREGGFLVRIDRDIPFDPEVDLHASEIALDEYDEWSTVIDNNGSLADLHVKLKSLLTSIKIVLTR